MENAIAASGLTKNFGQVRDMMKAMSSLSMMDRMKAITQFGKLAAGGMMPKFKLGGGTVKKRKESRKDKRKRRKKNR